MHNKLYCLSLALLMLLAANSGQSQGNCGFDHLHQNMLLGDSLYQKNQNKFSKDIQKHLALTSSAGKSETSFTIPVVVHVVYANEDAVHNISDNQVISGIDRLNDIFSDAGATGIDSRINFELARRTPDCQPTSGIVRVNAAQLSDYAMEGVDIEMSDTDGKGANRLDMFNLSRWNPAAYLNIWVVNEISDNNGGAGIQAFATLPGTNYFYDGIVILYNAFGYDYDQCNCFELKPYTSQNKTIAHEVGHYLGLYHTFEGDAGGYNCPPTDPAAGDEVADTPAHIRTYYCDGASSNNCYPPSDPYYDLNEVTHNYMGYVPEGCQNEFTPGQAERMQAVLETSRSGLVSSQGLLDVYSESLSLFCQPQTTQGITGEYGTGIASLSVGTLSAASGSTYQDGGYVDSWCTNATFTANTTYQVEVATYGYYNEDLNIYIDYDNSGSFSSQELIFTSFNKTLHSGTFTTPAAPLTNTPLRLRIISDHYLYNISDACYAPRYGQVEDYVVYLEETEQELVIERGYALKMNGISGGLSTDFSPDPGSQAFTYEFWCKPEGDPRKCQIIFNRTPSDLSAFNFMALWHGRIFVYFDNHRLFMDAEPIEYNQWHHLAYVWDGVAVQLYLNGQLAGSDTVLQVKPNLTNLYMGSISNQFMFFKGQIDELRCWDRVRSGSQIRQFMHHTKDIMNEEGLTYFHFNEVINDNLIFDLSHSTAATLVGNASLETSTVNTGYDGVQKTLTDIAINQDIYLPDVDLVFNFNNIYTELEFSITEQNFEANTYEGTEDFNLPATRMWTITPSSDGAFKTSIRFGFPASVFTGSNPSNCRLFHRDVNSDGNWTQLDAYMSHVDETSVTFQGINQAGQYIIVN